MDQSRYRSTEIDKIAAALATAQGSYKKLVPNQICVGGKFANLEATLDAVRDSISENGIAFYQGLELLDSGSGAALLWTSLTHASGQYIASCARIVAADSEKMTNNRTEIIKRTQAQMILGIAPSPLDPDSHDDNHDEASDKEIIEKIRKAKPGEPKVIIDREDVVNKNQYDELIIELDGYPELAQGIMETYGITTLADLPKSEYHGAKSRIYKIKRTYEDYNKRRAG